MVLYDVALPNHVIFDLYGVKNEILNDLEGIRTLVRRIVSALNSTLVSEAYKRLEPQGIIYIALLLQSHVSIHTWPEIGYVAVDVYTCSNVSVDKIEDMVLDFFKPKQKRILYVNRPVLPDQDQGEA